jgi:hypothetical protein
LAGNWRARDDRRPVTPESRVCIIDAEAANRRHRTLGSRSQRSAPSSLPPANSQVRQRPLTRRRRLRCRSGRRSSATSLGREARSPSCRGVRRSCAPSKPRRRERRAPIRPARDTPPARGRRHAPPSRSVLDEPGSSAIRVVTSLVMKGSPVRVGASALVKALERAGSENERGP